MPGRPCIAVLPHDKRLARRLADVSLADLVWPEGAEPPSGKVADLKSGDHLIVYPSSRILYRPILGVKCKLSLILAEPFAVQARHYRLIRLMYWRFHLVLTHNPWLLGTLRNGRFLASAGPWVRVVDPSTIEKTAHMSLIASAKRSQEGHRLRHEIADWIKQSNANVDLLGRAYRPLEDKANGLLPYRFSVIIENVREPGYFSEKLLDCILCNTVPIYWGAPDIADYFDTAGMIVCTSADEIKEAVSSLSTANYNSRLEAILNNRIQALAHANSERRAIEIVDRVSASASN